MGWGRLGGGDGHVSRGLWIAGVECVSQRALDVYGELDTVLSCARETSTYGEDTADVIESDEQQDGPVGNVGKQG